MPWYVLYTKSRNEKKLAKTLAEKDIRVYCPLKEEIRQWSDRKKKVTEPVFKSYIFVFLNDYKNECADILATPGAVRFLWWLGKPGVVRENEIEAIQHFITKYKNADILVEAKTGQSVTILEGPLRERTGTIYQVKGDKAYLYLDSLGMNLVALVPVNTLKINDKTA